MATARSEELRALAQRIADGLPAFVEEVVLTGSVSRGTADERSDIEMLVVSREPLTLEDAFIASGLARPETWGPRHTAARRVFGYVDGIPIEQIWWSRELAEEQVAAYRSAEAIAHGVSLRTVGLLERWQEHLRLYSEELARAKIEQAAESWGVRLAPDGPNVLRARAWLAASSEELCA